MNLKKVFATVVFFTLALVLFSSCAPQNSIGSENTSLSTQVQPVEIISPVSTQTPTQMELATITLSPTKTPPVAITPTLTPGVQMVMPELYQVNQCTSTIIGYGFNARFCIVSVWVKTNRHMVFNVTWTLTDLMYNKPVYKQSDTGNKNMFVTDNIGNRYDQIALGGDADGNIKMWEGLPVSGWFEFGAPPARATQFTFHDEDNNIIVTNIALDAAAIPYDTLPLSNANFELEYFKDSWTQSIKENGNNELTNSLIPECTIQSQEYRVAKGKYKNTMFVDKIKYEIFGYLDDANNLGYREYYAIGGLSSLSESNKVFFLVTIPLSKSDACLGAVSSALMGLKEVDSSK